MFARTLLVLLTSLAAACGGDETASPTAPNPAYAWFVDRAKESGLDVVHVNGMSGEFYYPEMFGPGVGLIDIDNDDDLDVYVVQGQRLGAAPRARPDLRDRLFRNDLTIAADGSRTLRFTDVTDAAGIDVRTYGTGVAAGDFDNDGWTDIYRMGLDGAVLWRNEGGRFRDVTRGAGVANAGSWGVSASFVDYDRDGWLDLYVANYVQYRLQDDVDCFNVAGQPDYCPPRRYTPARDRLYRNRGDRTFEDVTTRARLGAADGPGLGVSTADFDNDGWIDIYVGNDGEPNQLWTNQRNGTLRDTAFLSGVAVNGNGRPEASMGIDAGDYDNDGDEDLFVTNWASEMNVLYENTGGAFEDRRAASGLGPPSVARTGFATAWFDYDNDGRLDLLTVNGAVAAIESQQGRDPFPFRMPNDLYRNAGGGRFEHVSAKAGPAFASQQVGRGAAFGDVDNDGDTDVVVGNDAGPLQLLINEVGNRAHWVGLRLASVQPVLGARVTVTRADGSRVWRRARSDGSYASANDPRVLVGLGASAAPVRVRVQWPGGAAEEWTAVAAGRWHVLRKGTAR